MAIESEEALEIREKALKHMFVAVRSTDWLKKPGHFKTFVKGEGVRVKDINGKSYIDGAAGWQFGVVGHGRTEIGDAIREQINNVAIVAPEYTNLPAVRLAERLSNLTRGDMQRVGFCNSGSEAVDTAMKMARQYHVLNGDRGRFKVIARHGSYHGWTWGAMSVNGCRESYPIYYFEPLLQMARFGPQPYCYRCELDKEYPGCDMACVKAIEKIIQFEGPETVSAVLGEPVSHSNNVAVPPPEYWPEMRKMCDKYGVLIINDEVVTGFGRTGKWFAYQNWPFVPDVMTFAKGITSGYIPAAGAMCTPKISEQFDGGDDRKFFQISTWGGNPVSAAGALANLDILERENLVENSAKMGAYMLEGLSELKKSPIVGDVRAIGLCACVEFVADKKTKEFFNPELEVVDKLFMAVEEEGLLCREFGTSLLLTPPLTISKVEVDEVVAILDRVCSKLSKELGY